MKESVTCTHAHRAAVVCINRLALFYPVSLCFGLPLPRFVPDLCSFVRTAHVGSNYDVLKEIQILSRLVNSIISYLKGLHILASSDNKGCELSSLTLQASFGDEQTYFRVSFTCIYYKNTYKFTVQNSILSSIHSYQ